jgi:hypothetical protein
MKKNIVIGSLIVFLIAYLAFAADIRTSTGILCTDHDNAKMDIAPQYSLVDGTASVKTVTNFALTSNVVTLTSVAHGLVVGQQVTVALVTGPTGFASGNGTYIITAKATDTFSYQPPNHADIGSAAATGTATGYWVSEIPTQVALVFPSKAIHLVVVPTVANTTYSKVTSGTTNGTFIMYANVANHIDGMEGDTVFIQRANTTPLDFVFDTTR